MFNIKTLKPQICVVMRHQVAYGVSFLINTRAARPAPAMSGMQSFVSHLLFKLNMYFNGT